MPNLPQALQIDFSKRESQSRQAELNRFWWTRNGARIEDIERGGLLNPKSLTGFHFVRELRRIGRMALESSRSDAIDASAQCRRIRFEITILRHERYFFQFGPNPKSRTKVMGETPILK